jgi:hypothetical protein
MVTAWERWYNSRMKLVLHCQQNQHHLNSVGLYGGATT